MGLYADDTENLPTLSVRVLSAVEQGPGGIPACTVKGRTVGEALEWLVRCHPSLGIRLFDPTGTLRPSIKVFVGDVDATFMGSLDARVAEGQVLSILPAVACGTTPTRPVGIGLLGCGTVGAAVARALEESADHLEERLGASVEIVRVAVRDRTNARDVPLAPDRFTTEPFEVVRDPRVEVVVEAMGGPLPAGELLHEAIGRAKPVVTANKAVLGLHGPDLMAQARACGVPILFEAAVGGAAPVIRILTEYLAAERVVRLEGVLNGTSTFVLSLMAEANLSMENALAEARALGYAEADATRDLGGIVAADKLAILAHLAFGEDVRTPDVERLGVQDFTPADLRAAARNGREWRLVASAVRGGCVKVEPAALPAGHPLAGLRGLECGLVITAERAGSIALRGPGAGAGPTAAAVLADLVQAARHVISRRTTVVPEPALR